MAHALDGIRIVEVGEGKQLAYCGKLLRDLGAEVIKVEPPDGDQLRLHGPFPNDEPGPEQSGLFIYFNGGKQGARLDPGRAEDRAALGRLIEGADVLLLGMRPLAGAGGGPRSRRAAGGAARPRRRDGDDLRLHRALRRVGSATRSTPTPAPASPIASATRSANRSTPRSTARTSITARCSSPARS